MRAHAPILKHKLHPHEQAREDGGQESQSFRRADELVEEVLDAVDADDEADEVRGHHHEDVEHAAEGADVAVPWAIAELKGQSA